ncbi:hypothetical protein BDF14DRAFT_1742072 [Spinellus fusiger]|nr:hypothetical protein BDF14DRAFT_1742072 [Spinellus fusiger]
MSLKLQDEAYFHASSPIPLCLNLSEVAFLEKEYKREDTKKEFRGSVRQGQTRRWSLWTLRSAKPAYDMTYLFERMALLPSLTLDTTGEVLKGYSMDSLSFKGEDAEEEESMTSITEEPKKLSQESPTERTENQVSKESRTHPTAHISLSPFKHLCRLVILHLHPNHIQITPEVQSTLKHLVVKHSQISHILDLPWLQKIQLNSLSLANNRITTLEGLEHLQSLVHLDVSHNALTSIGPQLASLFNLESLNMSFNNITSTLKVHTVLGNLQELNLRGNKLSAVYDLDKVWALERLDLRENGIMELAHLPSLEMLWLQNNPCTETLHGDETPAAFQKAGSRAILDTAPPSTPSPHFIPKKVNETAPVTVSERQPLWPRPRSIAACERPHTQAVAPPIVHSKSLKTKRLVRLGEPLCSPKPHKKEDHNMHRAATLEQAVQEQRKSPHKKRSKSSLTKSVRSVLTCTDPHQQQPPVPPTDTEAFRRKIETIRQEAGTEWLRILQEMDLDNK